VTRVRFIATQPPLRLFFQSHCLSSRPCWVYLVIFRLSDSPRWVSLLSLGLFGLSSRPCGVCLVFSCLGRWVCLAGFHLSDSPHWAVWGLSCRLSSRPCGVCLVSRLGRWVCLAVFHLSDSPRWVSSRPCGVCRVVSYLGLVGPCCISSSSRSTSHCVLSFLVTLTGPLLLI
jgi:hypothetical protein